MVIMSSSTLIQTVSINYEDFNDSFLTCATCLCPYDQLERKPKLLSCSHTVCETCLERIAELPQAQQSGNFRCPICRETHQIPRGGILALPPSYLVNQLIDLMSAQRRDVVPKCGAHTGEELLFCETCDTVFCVQCVDPNDSNSSCHNHNIISFSIAIKRMSEILIYKANQCVKNLNKAATNVEKEMGLLDKNVDLILDQVNESFQNLSQMLEDRRREMIDLVRQTRDDKRRVLQEQLGIIQADRAKVEQQCNGLQYQVEVRNITRKISDLNGKLDSTLTLMEPRENAFLHYDSTTEEVLKSIQTALAHFGTLSVSRTFPPLCSVEENVPGFVYLESSLLVTTIDYNGQARTNGGDPVEAWLTQIPDDGGREMQPNPIRIAVDDHDDGTYSVKYRPHEAGIYQLEVKIFGRHIKNSPLLLSVSQHHPPVWNFGSAGSGMEANHFQQPVRVVATPDNRICVLDTGNNRVKILSDNCNEAVSFPLATGSSLERQTSVGLTMVPALPPNHRRSLLTLDWRSRSITEWTMEGQDLRTFTFSEFQEPIDLAVDSRGRIVIADNGAQKVFVFDPQARPLFSFPILLSTIRPTGRNGAANNDQITCVAIGMNEDILVGCTNGIQLFDSMGKFMRWISVTPPVNTQHIGNTAPRSRAGAGRGIVIGGLAVERISGTVLTSVVEKGKGSYLAVSQYKGDLRFCIDSHGSKLRRPSGVTICPDKVHCLVTDLASHSVRKFRFK